MVSVKSYSESQSDEGEETEVYLGSHRKTGEDVAIKVEWQKAEKGDKLRGEAKFYKSLGKCKDAPRIFWSGSEGQYNIMVMELLGDSLHKLFKDAGRFSLKTTLLLAEAIIDRLEYVHSRSVVYRDIKPHNFLMGRAEFCSQVYIVDFGLAKMYRDENGTHIPCTKKKRDGVTGTVRYSSLNVHEGCDASRRDDMEAVGYMLLHFLRGDLPWFGLKAASKKTKHELIRRKKLETTDEELCKGFPEEFLEYFRYCRALEFADRPDYEFLRSLMRTCAQRKGLPNDGKFDWDTAVDDAVRPIAKTRKRSSSRKRRREDQPSKSRSPRRA
eukprot:TRINITY_DN22948_c0_g1_i1.p1 TRINITY_DN22948_c0_g1~~TRINITY_DN22948_c0_g1_i1.p1  ORF type:complete len:327 (+),score=60.74 TRINITY_DN22948_c0_g1_i1:53-1033(+)